MSGSTYFLLKAIHIIFVVSYFAGVFYMVRLFVYHTEANELEEPEKSILKKQYSFMETRLWNIITVPAFVIMLLTGLSFLLFRQFPFYFKLPWMHIKISFLFTLFLYHYWIWKTIKELKKDIYKMTSLQLRMMNEVATLILFAVVFIVIFKDSFFSYWYWFILSFIGAGILIMAIVRLVNKPKK